MFKVGDLVQTKRASRRGAGGSAFTLASGWIGLVLEAHPTGALRVHFSELSWTDKPCELWADPELLVSAQ